MDPPINLIPLVCIQCGTQIPADPEETAWVCGQCGQGMLLDDEKGLTPLEIHYAAGIPAQAKGRPYWVAQGQVALQRESYSGGSKEASQAQQFWSQPHTFFIPAFTCTLEDLLAQSARLLLQPPALQAGASTAFEPVTTSPDEIQPIAEFIVMAIEADRRDQVKHVEFTLQLSTPVLWVLP